MINVIYLLYLFYTIIFKSCIMCIFLRNLAINLNVYLKVYRKISNYKSRVIRMEESYFSFYHAFACFAKFILNSKTLSSLSVFVDCNSV